MSAARSRWMLLLSLATSSGLACAFQLLATAGEAAARRDELAVDPLPMLPSRCALGSAEALGHARAAEQMARALWERVPMAVDEAPRALLLMAEAELCYGARDREGRLRSASQRHAYEVEITRRFTRARLLLRVALHEARLDRAREQIATLRALLSRARPEAEAYRAELERLDRHYAAELSERAGKSSS